MLWQTHFFRLISEGWPKIIFAGTADSRALQKDGTQGAIVPATPMLPKGPYVCNLNVFTIYENKLCSYFSVLNRILLYSEPTFPSRNPSTVVSIPGSSERYFAYL